MCVGGGGRGGREGGKGVGGVCICVHEINKP